MRPSECDFTVPERLFPLSPPELRGERRDHARPAVLDRSCTRLEHGRFDKLGSYLREGDVLVVNNTKMVHDQLSGQTSRGPVRLVLFGHHVDGWHAAVSPASRGAGARRPDRRGRAPGGARQADVRGHVAGEVRARRRLLRAPGFDLFGDSMLIVWTGCSTATGRVTRRVAPWRRYGDVG
ncbi:MAG: S-adenosylmethionine:tRNA ribosyltransferase-isomerase [Acidimicrobiales bacterium]|jgi:hypothetical protein